MSSDASTMDAVTPVLVGGGGPVRMARVIGH